MAKGNVYDIAVDTTTGEVSRPVQGKKDEYVNFNVYKEVDGVPMWLFRVSTVPMKQKATEAFLKAQVVEAYASKGIKAFYLEGNLRKEEVEMESDF